MARRPVADWAAIKLEYVAGGVTVAALAAKHGVKPGTLRKQVERGRWGVERIRFAQEAVAEATDAAKRERVEALSEFNRDNLGLARAIREQVETRLAEGVGEISASELRQLASAAEVAHRMGRLALGASTGNIGHAGGNGEGPVEFDVPVDDYLEARLRALEAF